MADFGRYRHRVQIQTYQTPAQQTTLGGRNQVWETVAWRYAAIEPLDGSEPQQAEQSSPDVTHEIRCRFWEPTDGTRLGPAYRIVWGSRTFNLVSVRNPGEQGQGTEMILRAKEIV